MNLDSLSFALSQISYSVANLTKKNYKSSIQEISHLIAQHGAEADRHLFRCLFSHVDFSGDGKSSGKDFHQTQYLIQECASLITKPNFVSTLCYAIDNPLHHQKSLKSSAHLLGQLSKVLKLTRVQEVSFAVALLKSSNSDTRQHATQFLRDKLPKLIAAYIDTDASGDQESGLQDIAIEVLHLVLNELAYNQENLRISAEQREQFLKAIQKDFPKERVPAILAPCLHPDPEDISINKLNLEVVSLSPLASMDGSLADMIREVGYGFTASLEECRSNLGHFGPREITPRAVARVLGMMSETTTGLSNPISIQSLSGSGQWPDGKDKDPSGSNSWNINVLVQVLREVTPQLNWKEVVSELDYPEFRVGSKAGLQLLVGAFYRGFPQPLSETFPMDLLYRPWTNTEGQLSWIVQSLKNPDVFCFSDYPCHAVQIDILKTPPDEKAEINTWKSRDLVEILLRLSEHGHYQNISELFKFPVNNCPDMLVLALLQIPTWNTLKHELLSGLIPTFLGNHPNSLIVLHYAWHHPGQSATIRTLIMHAMAEWYMRGEPHDQSRLSRILDVAQDLKALSMLLNATPFAFVIDLACLASRREYLRLDKWLADKIGDHGEPFVQACVHFLKRRCPQLMGTTVKDDQGPQSKAQQLPPDTVRAMLACLQACASNVAQELSEAIFTMVTNASAVLQKRQGAPTPTSAIVGPPKGGLGPSLQGVPNPATPPSIEPIGLGGLGGLGPQVGGPPAPQPTSSITNTSPFSASLGSLTSTPGSPAKSFPTLGQVTGNTGTTQGPAFNPIQTLTSQIQGLSMQTTMSTGMPSTSLPVSRPSGAPTLGALSGAALKQPQTPETLRHVPGGVGEPSAFKESGMPGAGGQPPSGDPTPIFPNMNQQFPKEIEDEANSYFQRIYNHAPNPSLSIDEVLEMLKRFKDSANRKEKDVYLCMLRNLFEEYRYFSQYPDRELHITSVLFGGIIEQKLVAYMELGVALRYVLEALRKPHGSKMYFFGIAALDRFKTRLKIYPQYCQYLEAIPHFNQFPQHLKEYIEYGARSQEPPYRPPQPQQMPLGTGAVTPPTSLPSTSTPAPIAPIVAPTPATTAPSPATATTSAPGASHGAIGGSRPHTSAPSSRPSIATATNIDTLLAGTEGKEEVAVPPEQVQDKVFFIFNNLSLANMDQKAGELKENISDEYMLWVAQYLVMKRASIEHNFHTLYANFIDHLKKGEGFIQLVIKETHRNIKVLLRSDKGVANFSDRSLLKNLGHWLGLLTLARNKPILQLDIDLKSLLYEAYHKGSQELLYVVPFVAKVIESCAKSKVFKPPNPWTMAIMNVLAELHQEPELKLNLKFEIEVLCKNLNIDINDLTAGQYLADVERMNTLEFQLSDPSKKTESSSTPQPDDPLEINMPTPTTPAVTTAVTMTTATTTTPVVVPPQPQFGYHEINVMSLSGLSGHININDNLVLFQQHPNLKQLVRQAIERSVQELLPPVVERSIKIALTTSEQIVKKDFALDPEESRMRAAAHHMVRFMTAGMALITCREPLVLAINNNLKQNFSAQIRTPTPQQKELMEHTAHVLAQDNVELACSFIQKTAVEKAIPEMDKRLATEYELRKHARNEGRRYCDPVVLTYQAERMPEQIRLKVGGVTHQQIAVYEEFARNIPGFLPTAQEANQSSIAAQKARPPPQQQQVQQPEMPHTVGDEVTQIYDKITQDIDQLARNMIAPPGNPQVAAVGSLIEAVLVARGNAFDMMTAVRLVQKAVEGLLDGLSPQPNAQDLMMRYRDCHVLVLKGLQDPRAYGPQWTNKMVTRYLLECREEFKYNVEAIDCLIRHHLVSMQQYDMHLAQSMENGLNYMATAFAMQILQRFFVDAKDSSIGEGDFFNTIETLARIAVHSRQAPEGLTALIDSIRASSDSGLLERAPGGPTSMMHSGISQAREFDDPPGLHDKTEYLLREWVNMYHSPAAGRDSYKAFSAFVAQMHQQGILKTDDLITRFFRLCTEMCVDLCYRALSEHNQSPTLIRAKCFHTLDAFVRLIALLVKHSGDTTCTVTKINLLNKVLGIVAGVLLQDHEVRHTDFQQLPYHRIFIMLFIEVNAPEHVLESINFQVLTAFCNTFHILRPAKAPGFAYAWLELVSHRVFIGRMLAITPQQRNVPPSGDNAHPGWNMYAQLLIDLFKFLAPFLRNAELAKPTQLLYKGTLRVLLVLLHDFPEFLCDYHYTFCDVIPPNCVQMRNLILSAFPRTMRLPDPFTPNLKVDMLPEISAAPRIMTNFANMIQPAAFKKDLESYLKTRSPVTFLSELRSKLQIQISSEPGMRYNLPMMNALVLYVGTQAIAYIHSKGLTPSMSTIAHSSHMDIFQNLAVDLDTEGRFLFLNAIANQLRYPNSHTHYFSCTLLYLFAEANTEAIQEQITRVLLERLIVNRPHPWGLLITFIELIKNPQFRFWNHEFVHCAPEIEKLFESVARSCMQPKQAQGIREHETPEIH